MSTVQVEQVLVVKTALFHEIGCFQGFCEKADDYLPTLLNPINTQYLPRDQMEQDPSFKQLIPYCIFQYVDGAGQNHVFQYTRGKGSGETRLHSKKSVGIGGHISTLDADEQSPYDVGMQRELDEEISINTPYQQQLVGMINDDSNDVGAVHLGVVHLFTVESNDIKSRESEIDLSGFQPVDEALAELDRYETWSQFCLTALFGE